MKKTLLTLALVAGFALTSITPAKAVPIQFSPTTNNTAGVPTSDFGYLELADRIQRDLDVIGTAIFYAYCIEGFVSTDLVNAYFQYENQCNLVYCFIWDYPTGHIWDPSYNYTLSMFTSDYQSIRTNLFGVATTIYMGSDSQNRPLIDTGAFGAAVQSATGSGTGGVGLNAPIGSSSFGCWYAVWFCLYCVIDLEDQYFNFIGSNLP